jgi:hypothetical protein
MSIGAVLSEWWAVLSEWWAVLSEWLAKYVYGGGVARPLAAGHAGGYSLSKWYCCIADIA